MRRERLWRRGGGEWRVAVLWSFRSGACRRAPALVASLFRSRSASRRSASPDVPRAPSRGASPPPSCTLHHCRSADTCAACVRLCKMQCKLRTRLRNKSRTRTEGEPFSSLGRINNAKYESRSVRFVDVYLETFSASFFHYSRFISRTCDGDSSAGGYHTLMNCETRCAKAHCSPPS